MAGIVRRCSLVLLSLVLFIGCGTARPIMPVPQALEATSVMQVKRFRGGVGSKPMRFGEWTVMEFARDRFPDRSRWTVRSPRAPISLSKSHSYATYDFVLSPDAGEQWECRCEQTRNQRDLGIGSSDSPIEVPLTYDELLDCDLRRLGDDDAIWKLQVSGSLAIGGEGYRGTLALGDHTLALEPSHHIEGGLRLPGPPIGYLFVREGEQIASAELITPGHIRISEGAGDDRAAVATAVAALLMQPSAH